MGKLNIAHHKSYHPYRRDNIERVRRDEEEAACKEAEQEGRIALADAEARLALLRERAGIGGKGKDKGSDVQGSTAAGLEQGSATGSGSGKHINLFEDLEQVSVASTSCLRPLTSPSEAEKGVPLAPSAKDLNPWYSDKARDRGQLVEDEKDERRDLRFKSMNDPLTSITQQLAARSSPRPPPPSTNLRSRDHRSSRPSAVPPPPKQLDPTTARLSRESSERDRALALIRRKQREMAGSETPSTVRGGMDEGYGDVYNKRAVEEAHAHRDSRWRRKGW
ncbi:hypothetical protein EV363DRAFT_1151589 [Boletus edulis]|nr:hypothetical protein EV363DRAFT_1151589 [Boletus edulis]